MAQTPGAPADPEWEWALAQSGAGRIPRKELPGRFSPGVYGLRRPVLVLPQFFQEDYSPRERRMIYLHELSHIRRGDPYFHMALQLLKRGFYLHQPLRKQLRRLELYREQCCDRQVLAALRTGPADYGALLLRQMGRCGEDHALSFCGSGFQSAQGRLSALFQESRRQWGKRLACMGCVVLVTLAVSAALPYRDPPSGAYMLIVECRGELEVFPLEQVSQAEAVLSGCPGYEQAALFQPRYLWSGMLGCYTAGDAVPLDCK